MLCPILFAVCLAAIAFMLGLTWEASAENDGTYNINLNGYNITYTGENDEVIGVSGGTTLNLFDSSDDKTGKIAGSKGNVGSDIYASTEGPLSTFDMYGGIISDNEATGNGGGVCNQSGDKSTFNVYNCLSENRIIHILARKKVKDVIFCLHINIFFAILYKCPVKGHLI